MFFMDRVQQALHRYCPPGRHVPRPLSPRLALCDRCDKAVGPEHCLFCGNTKAEGLDCVVVSAPSGYRTAGPLCLLCRDSLRNRSRSGWSVVKSIEARALAS